MRRGLRRFGLYPAFPRFGFQKQPPRLLRGSSLLKGRATQWPFFFLVFWLSTALVHSGRTASTALAPFLVAEPKYRRRTSWSSCGLRCRCDMGRADSTVPCLASSIPLRIPAKSSWSSCALLRQFRHSRTDSTVCAFLPCTASRIPAKGFLVFVCIVSEDLGRCVAL